MAINEELVAQIQQRVAQLRQEVKAAQNVVVRIPDWDPVNLDEGLNWMWQSLAEGYYVKSRVTWAGTVATIWMKIWEFGEEEPDWDE